MITKIKELDKKIYLIGIFFVCLKIFTERSELFAVDDTILIIMFLVCFALKMIFQKFTKRELIITCISGIISFAVSIVTKEFVVLYLFFILFASKDINVRDIIKVSFFTISIILLISIIIYGVNALIGDIPTDYRKDGTVRYTFYLNHANIFAGLILWLTAQYLYLRYDKINKKTYVIIGIIYLLTYVLTQSRTTLIASYILLGLILINKHTKIDKKIINLLAKYSFIILGTIMILLGFLYSIYSENYILKQTNKVFSYRIFLQSASVEKYGISIFPRNIDLTEKIRWESGAYREVYLDSIFSRTLVKYGIIYMIFLVYISLNTVNKKSDKESVFMILFSIVATMERYMLLPTIGFPILFFKTYLWNEETNNTEILPMREEKYYEEN